MKCVIQQIKYSFNFYQHSTLEIEALRLAMNDPKFRPEPLTVINVSGVILCPLVLCFVLSLSGMLKMHI